LSLSVGTAELRFGVVLTPAVIALALSLAAPPGFMIAPRAGVVAAGAGPGCFLRPSGEGLTALTLGALRALGFSSWVALHMSVRRAVRISRGSVRRC
jgi:hypothetical protein